MIGRALAVADGEAMANGLRHVGLGRLHRVQHRSFPCQVSGQRRGKGSACPVGMLRVDVLAFEDVEEAAVIQEIGAALGQ